MKIVEPVTIETLLKESKEREERRILIWQIVEEFARRGFTVEMCEQMCEGILDVVKKSHIDPQIFQDVKGVPWQMLKGKESVGKGVD